MMQPFATHLDFSSGTLLPVPHVITRRLSDMRRLFSDSAALERAIADGGDSIVYQVYPVALPEDETHLLHCTTVIQPGKVGDEYFMTKGHYHAKRDRGEVYLGIAGEGMVLLQLEDGTAQAIPMHAGTAAYVPPNWGHRTINTGSIPFVFFSAWNGDAGHDYGAIEQTGFAKLIIDNGGTAAVVDNPRWK